MATPNDDYDTPWKDAVTRYFPDFVAFYFPLAHAEIDWSCPQRFLEQELAQVAHDAELGKRLADKLVEVTLKGGAPQWVLVHLEVQGRRDSRFAERMFTYNYRIFDRYRRPVASMALLADGSAGWKPDSFGYQLLGCTVGIQFPVVKLDEFAGRAEQLLDDPNPFALVTAAYLATRDTKGDDVRRAAAKWFILERLLLQNRDRRIIIDLTVVIDWLMRLPQPLEHELWRRIEKFERDRAMPYISSFERIGLERGLKQGLLEGRREGCREGQALLLSNMLAERFGALPAHLQQRLAQGTSAELLAWSKAFVNAATLDEVFNT
ncbi:putative transposase YdaD [Janthinobacterium sp. CG_23.3]|uniref:DUF4351 domain-containing protein n=1 Tax=Janthinobacterium sp. CG_23.3 TaxID=3349634 RepID=UPI0038D4344C